MKHCTKCNTTKATSFFHRDKSSYDGLQGWCATCKSRQARDWNHRNPTKVKARTYKRKRLSEAYIRSFKVGKACLDCGGQFPDFCLDFDHLGNKSFSVSQMRNGYSIDSITAEIEKCELVCANCHRIRTHTRRFLNRS